jgi:polysaccharide export outer membrane protein
MTKTNTLLGLLLVAVVAATTGCVETVDAQTPKANAPCVPKVVEPPTPQAQLQELAPPTAYQIGKQDSVQITVSPEPELNEALRCSRKYQVQSDGTIVNFCSLPAVKAEGLTEQMLAGALKEQLIKSGQYTSVTVDVTITEYKSQSVYVSGAVRTPGDVQLTGNQLTMTKAINKAGGWAAEAGTEVYLLRPPSGMTGLPMTLDDPRLEAKERHLRKDLVDARVDPPVKAGDTIFVTSSEVFWINGEVRAGGQKIYEDCMTLADAISLAGGISANGSMGRSYIQRRNAKGEYDRIKDLKNETRIMPRDTIQIERKLF